MSADPIAQARIRAQIDDKAKVIIAHLDNMRAMAQYLAERNDQNAVETYISVCESMMARVQGRVA